jgi:hypothetical protein
MSSRFMTPKLKNHNTRNSISFPERIFRYSKPSIGSSGHTGGTRPGQTRKKPKDLSACDREECGSGEGGSVYAVYIRERGAGGRGGCRLRITISDVIHL